MERLRTLVLDYDPDLILYGYVLNDPQADSLEGNTLRDLHNFEQRRFSEQLSHGAMRLLSHSRLITLGALLIRDRDRPAGSYARHVVTGKLIDEGVEMLRADPTLDSAVTVSRYNMWSPLRARKLGGDGCLHPFVPFETFGNPTTLNCDRDSQGDVHFADMSVSVVRPKCLENLEEGLLPQKWMGQRIAPIPSWGGCDVDYEFQVPTVEFWLREHGIEEV